MFQERIVESVTPSGVEFAVRALKGMDQNTLGDENIVGQERLNKMLKNCLRKLGDKSQIQITEDDVKGMLTNDRKFIFVLLRNFSLNFDPKFKFKYEWPIGSSKNKEVFEYEVNMTHENFPVKPYIWMREKIEADKALAEAEKDSEYKDPDGFQVKFPKLYESYAEMLKERSEYKGAFSCDPDKTQYIFRLLNGVAEEKWGPVIQKKKLINDTLEMRQPRYLMGGQYVSFDTSKADINYVEELREAQVMVEGDVDTYLVIEHKTDLSRTIRVDVVALPVFFFPSQAK